MAESNVLVNFRLDREKPLRLKWIATDGVPGDGYKAQVTTIKLSDGTVIEMDQSSILEHAAADPSGGIGAYLVTFNGMVGYALDHPSHDKMDSLGDEEIDFELVFIHEDTGREAVENEDYRIVDRPRAMAHKMSKRE